MSYKEKILTSMRSYGTLLIPNIAGLGVQFGGFFAVAVGLGVESLGKYAVILSLSAIGSEMINFGRTDLYIKGLALRSRNHSVLFSDIVKTGTYLIFPVCLILTLFATYVLSLELSSEVIFIGLFGEVLFSRSTFSAEMMIVGNNAVLKSNIFRFCIVLARAASAVAFFQFCQDLDIWLGFIFILSLLTCAISYTYVCSLYGGPDYSKPMESLYRGLFFGLQQISVANQGNIDRVILSIFTSSATVGQYTAGSRVLQIGTLFISIITRQLYPKFFVVGREGIVASSQFAIQNMFYMLCAAFCGVLATSFVGVIVPYVLGSDFSASTFITICLSCALPFIGMQYLAADALTGAGFQTLRTVVYICNSTVFGLSLALGAYLGGLSGMVFAYLTAHGLLAIALWIIVAFLKRVYYSRTARGT